MNDVVVTNNAYPFKVRQLGIILNAYKSFIIMVECEADAALSATQKYLDKEVRLNFTFLFILLLSYGMSRTLS